jgi:hypothetical protein
MLSFIVHLQILCLYFSEPLKGLQFPVEMEAIIGNMKVVRREKIKNCKKRGE